MSVYIVLKFFSLQHFYTLDKMTQTVKQKGKKRKDGPERDCWNHPHGDRQVCMDSHHHYGHLHGDQQGHIDSHHHDIFLIVICRFIYTCTLLESHHHGDWKIHKDHHVIFMVICRFICIVVSHHHDHLHGDDQVYSIVIVVILTTTILMVSRWLLGSL